MDTPVLIAGLGNPGEKYASTWHNIGFAVIDELARRWRVSGFQGKHEGLIAQAPAQETGAGTVLLLKPQTFMNLSGRSVADAVRFYKIPVETHFLALTDDLDLPPGALRLRLFGGTGGHNGLKSLAECLGTDKFARLRMGVGRSATLPPEAHLLTRLAGADRLAFEKLAVTGADAVERCVKDGFSKAMNSVNQRSGEK